MFPTQSIIETSLNPGKCSGSFKCIIFKHNLEIDIFSSPVNISLKWMPEDLADG